MRTIRCNVCEQDLPVEEFYAAKVSDGTKRSRCKKCNSKKSREWALANKERANETCRRYQKNKRDAGVLSYSKSHPGYIREYMAEWRAKNPEAQKEISRRYRENNKEKILVRNRQRAIAEVTAIPLWANKKAITEIYMAARKVTKETGVEHHVDHIIPLRGKTVCGLHVESNLQIITKEANLKKWAKFEVMTNE